MDLARELKDDEALEHDASLEIIAALDVGEMQKLETALSLELGDDVDAGEGATAEDPTRDAPVDEKTRRSLAHVATSPAGLPATFPDGKVRCLLPGFNGVVEGDFCGVE